MTFWGQQANLILGSMTLWGRQSFIIYPLSSIFHHLSSIGHHLSSVLLGISPDNFKSGFCDFEGIQKSLNELMKFETLYNFVPPDGPLILQGLKVPLNVLHSHRG